MRNVCSWSLGLQDFGSTLLVYLQDVRPWLLHDMCQAEEMKQSLSHKSFPLPVATQGLADLRLVCFSRYLLVHKTSHNEVK